MRRLLIALATLASTACVEKRVDIGTPAGVHVHVYLLRAIAKQGEWPRDIVTLAQPFEVTMPPGAVPKLFIPTLHIHRADLPTTPEAKLNDGDPQHLYEQLLNQYRSDGLNGKIRAFYGKTPDLHALQEVTRVILTRDQPPGLLSVPGQVDIGQLPHVGLPDAEYILRPIGADMIGAASVAPLFGVPASHIIATADEIITAIAHDLAAKLQANTDTNPIYAVMYEPHLNVTAETPTATEGGATTSGTIDVTPPSTETLATTTFRESPPAEMDAHTAQADHRPDESRPCDRRMVEVAPGVRAPKNMCPPGYTGPDENCKCWPSSGTKE